MVKMTITRSKFLQLSDQRFYLADGVVSLPFYHPVLAEIDDFKEKGQNICGKKRKICSGWEKVLKITPDYIYMTKF